MKQQITNIILEMIGDDKKEPIGRYEVSIEEIENSYRENLREKAPEIAERICDEINNPVEYNTAQKYVLKTAIENLGEIDDEQYEFIRNNLLSRFK